MSISSLSEIINNQQIQMSEVNNQPKPNELQPIILVSLKQITEKEKNALARIPDLRIFQVNKLSKNLNMLDLKDKFDLIILDAFDDTCFQMLRENYKTWQVDFNLTLLQRNGFSSDATFSSYFENIVKRMPLDAANRENFYKGMNASPYIKRPQPAWRVILKKVLSWVLKL